MSPNDSSRFRVLAVDDDASVELQSLDLKHQAGARGLGNADTFNTLVLAAFGVPMMGTTVWCRPDRPLCVGDYVTGHLEFDPRESFTRGRLPRFTVEECG